MPRHFPYLSSMLPAHGPTALWSHLQGQTKNRTRKCAGLHMSNTPTPTPSFAIVLIEDSFCVSFVSPQEVASSRHLGRCSTFLAFKLEGISKPHWEQTLPNATPPLGYTRFPISSMYVHLICCTVRNLQCHYSILKNVIASRNGNIC